MGLAAGTWEQGWKWEWTVGNGREWDWKTFPLISALATNSTVQSIYLLILDRKTKPPLTLSVKAQTWDMIYDGPINFDCNTLHTQVTWLVVTESEAQASGWCCTRSIVCPYVAPPGECYYNTITLRRIFFIDECGIARFLCDICVFEVRTSSSSPRLPLCQISFLSPPPLPS